MRIEVDPQSGAVRLDDAGLDALSQVATTALQGSSIGERELIALREPVVSVDLVVASATTRVQHRAFLIDDAGAVLLGVASGLHQLMALPPAYLASALVRMSRLKPRRVADRVDVPFPASRLDDLVSTDQYRRTVALDDASADLAWRLALLSTEHRMDVTATDGPGGVRLAEPGADVLRALTNTAVYRIFSTALFATGVDERVVSGPGAAPA